MNVLSILNEAIDSFDFEGINSGLFVGLDIQILIDNKEELIKYYMDKELHIKSKDDLVDFLVLYKYSRFDIFYDNIKPEFQKNYKDLISFIQNKYCGYNADYYINFINNNVDEIINIGNVSAIKQLIAIITPYINGCKTFINKLLSEKLYLFLPFNDNIKKYIESDAEIVGVVLNTRQYDEIKYHGGKDYFELIKFLIKKGKYKTIIEDVLEDIYQFGISLCNSCNGKNVFEYLILLEPIYELFKELKSPKAFEFDKRINELNMLKNEFVVKNATYHKQEIPIKEIESYFIDEKIPWDVRFLSLTHKRKDINTWISYYDDILNSSKKESIFDKFINYGLKTDGVFTKSKQFDIDVYMQIYTLILQRVFIGGERSSEFISHFYEVVSTVYEAYNVNYDSERLKVLLNSIQEMFINISNNKDNELLTKGLCYGLSMFICGTIEEFLTNIFRQLQHNIKYIDINHSTLSLMLNDEIMQRVFTKGDIKIIKFFLTKENDIGFDYRNQLAHFKTLNTSDMKYSLPLSLLYVFIYVVNCSFVNIIHNIYNIGDK